MYHQNLDGKKQPARATACARLYIPSNVTTVSVKRSWANKHDSLLKWVAAAGASGASGR